MICYISSVIRRKLRRVHHSSRDVYARVTGTSEKGREKGRKEGRKEGLKEVARSMLASGMAEELILNLTGLEQEVLDKLKDTTA